MRTGIVAVAVNLVANLGQWSLADRRRSPADVTGYPLPCGR